MKDRGFMKLRAATAWAALLRCGLLGLAFAAAVSLRAQEVPATNSPAGQVVTAYLDYQDANYSYINEDMRMVLKSSAFKKEPALSRGKVIRGTWQLGGDASNEVAFVWDRGARKLYVDLNRNLDLADDPAGVYSSATGGPDYFQMFPNVRLPLKAGVGSRLMLADLSFYDYEYSSQPNCTAALHSFWQGKVTLQGKEWQVGLLGTSSVQRVSLEGGNLLLRPWAERNKPFNLFNGTLAVLPSSQKVFFGNRAYGLQCASQNQGDNGKVEMQFTEQTPKLGELKIAGTYIQHATLEGGTYLVVLDQPEATVKVPVGRYKTAKVWVKRGDTEAYLDGRFQAVGRITVAEKAPVVLLAGGPLTNSVDVMRRGKYLALNYRLTGAGGSYQLVNQDRSHPPEFTVYQGDKKISSGKFEFG
jgi:hypothetical protein